MLVLHGWFDGACRPTNPGEASYGWVLKYPSGDVLAKGCNTIGYATNNVAEWEGLIALTEACHRHGGTRLVGYGDSDLIIRQALGKFRVKAEHLAPLKERFLAAARALVDGYSLTHVRREYNREADHMASLAFSKGDERHEIDLEGVQDALSQQTCRMLNADLRKVFGPDAAQLPEGADIGLQSLAFSAIKAYRKLQFAVAPGPINTKGIKFPVRLTK